MNHTLHTVSPNKPLDIFHLVCCHSSWANPIHSQSESQCHDVSHCDTASEMSGWEKLMGLNPLGFHTATNPDRRLRTGSVYPGTRQQLAGPSSMMPVSRYQNIEDKRKGNFVEESQRDGPKEWQCEAKASFSFGEDSHGGETFPPVTLSKTWVWTMTQSS